MPENRIQEYIQSLIDSPLLGGQVAAHGYEAPRTAQMHAVPDDWPDRLGRMLHGLGINQLYSHQLEAIQTIGAGRHVVVSTPTASGKSLIYNLPVFRNVTADADSRAIYVFPLKALTQDQLKTFEQWAGHYGEDGPSAAVYDGDTSAYRRRKIRRDHPNVIMTNPEMLHLALLPHHDTWADFFRQLKLVVIDEVHTYRGLLGCHMAQVLRRLERVCCFYGAQPTFVFASATIGNPGYLTEQLTGLNVTAIEKNGAPSGGRHSVVMDPAEGPSQTAIQLLKAAMARELRTIVYVQSRKMAELITLWVQQRAGRFAEKISVYRAGLLPQERRSIESDLKSGRLLAVVSTSALELGIDIGDLDLCILVGYPGSIMASRQRGGRVGRKGQDAAVIMLAGQDGLDQYFVANPEAYFNGQPETAVINPYNPVVLEAHLTCAAAELPLRCHGAWRSEKQVKEKVHDMEHKGQLLRSADGRFIHSLVRRPHHKVDLRSAGDRFGLFHGDQLIGEVNAFRLYRETHAGAIYLHKGQTFLVDRLDEEGKCVFLDPAKVHYHTRTRTHTDIEVQEIMKYKFTKNTRICNGKVKVTDQVVGFQRIETRTGRTLDYTELDVQPSIFVTDSIWFEIGTDLRTNAHAMGYDLLGALHAAEHAAIGIMPLIILADRNDLGGLATPHHPHSQSAVIFIYDGIPGGAGLSRQAFDLTDKLMDNVVDLIDRCQCEKGCPACIHSPKCGSGNHPMDKAGARYLFDHIRRPAGPGSTAITEPPKEESIPPIRKRPGRPIQHFGVFDLETQRSAKQVGGWHMAHRMLVSCGVVYDSGTDEFHVYMEEQVDDLINHLRRLDLVVGFNSKRFDYRVLSGYSDFDFTTLPSLDLLERVHRQLGFRLSLDHLAEQTLKAKKSGSGLEALEWWQTGEIQKIIDYCKKDVQLTLDLYLHSRDNGYLIYRRKDGQKFRVPVHIDGL